MDGTILMDKSSGITSSQYLNKVKKILKVSKAGHTGTLDPFATGLMTICLNKATRIIPFLNEDIKEYYAVMKFGEATDTMDCTGNITQKVDLDHLEIRDISGILDKYSGSVEQTPPDYSAIKVNGIRSYKLARKGVKVQKPKRKIHIERITIINYDFPFLTFTISCSRGTYVRAVADSIGRDLGVGSHLTELRRIKSGRFTIEDSYTLNDIEMGKYNIIDLNESLDNLKLLNIDKSSAELIKNGINIKKYMLPQSNITDINIGDYIKIMANNELIGIFVSLFAGNEIIYRNDNDDILKIKKILH